MTETLPVLYRDATLIAVAKPSGLLVHRTMIDRHETRFALQIVRNQIGAHVWPTHRLDKGTSGVLLFALDADTACLTGSAFENGLVRKRYLALVRGYPQQAGCIDHPLTPKHDPYEDHAHPEIHLSQRALTHYLRLATTEQPWPITPHATSRFALLALWPETGRRHQIRRHLKHLSYPIIGDSTYGKGAHNRLFAEKTACKRLMLAATHLSLPHPHTGEVLNISAPLAEDFANALRLIELPVETTVSSPFDHDGGTNPNAVNFAISGVQS